MARTGQLGRLVVDVSANVAALQADVSKVQSQLKRVQRSSKSTARELNKITSSIDGFKRLAVSIIGVTGPLILAQRAFTGFINAVERADTIVKAADKVGVSTDALQEFRFAAKLAGVEQRQLDLGLQRFSRRVGEANIGTGELLTTVEKYGIKLRDSNGQLRKSEDILGDFAEAIKNAGSEQEQLRIAFKLFDSEGAALVNLLRGGRDSVAAFRQEARNLGVVLNEDLLRSAEDTRDEMTRLSAVIEARLTQAFVSVGPIVSELIDDWLTGFELLTKEADEFFKITSGAKAQATQSRIQELTNRLETLQERLEESKRAQEEGGVINRVLFGSGAFLESNIKETEKRIQDLTSEIARLQATLLETPTEPPPPPVPAGEKIDIQSQLDEKERAAIRELEITEFLENRKTELAIAGENQRAQASAQAEETKRRIAQSTVSNLAGLLGVLGQKSKAAAIAAIAISKAQAIAQAIQTGIVAQELAFASQVNPLDPSSYARGTAAAASVKAWTAANVAIIAATGLAQAGSVGGGAPGGGGGGSANVGGLSEFDRGTVAEPALAPSQTTIIIEGNIVDHDQFARETIPAIEKALSDGVGR